MNNTFSISRFGRYFKYDFKRWVSTYGPTLLLMSAAPLILYTLTVVYSLLFAGESGGRRAKLPGSLSPAW